MLTLDLLYDKVLVPRIAVKKNNFLEGFEMNKLQVINNKKIEDYIFEVRGKLVILDSDLASLYHCANGTKDINKAVKRNKERFPEQFCFQLTKEEYKEVLRFQNGTLELKKGKYSKYLPFVFTEAGIGMLSGVLHTEIAINTSIAIMEAFVNMKNYLSKELLDILSKTNKKIIIYSKNFNDNLINKYNSQYNNVTFKIDDSYHDRFIIIDKKDVYHSGASFKDLGKKCFAINKINDEDIMEGLLDGLNA